MILDYKYSYLFVTLLFGLLSCDRGRGHHSSHNESGSDVLPLLISEQGAIAGGAYFSRDNNNHPVLSWTEETEQLGEYILKYANFDINKNQFSESITVSPSKGTRLHSESMNKVATKKDGTVVAVFAVKHPTAANRFAGSIFYTLSTDQGMSWSKPAYLHSDTLPVYGRGYFDLEMLPDGEIGANWLDGRFGENQPGSALFFAKTEPGKGFGNDQLIGESTCECCRTDLFVDNMGGIHTAYRAILFPSALMGQQVRDMVHSVSHDGGKTFSTAKRISADNWAIEGCPHTGPSLAANQDGLHAAWFTAGGDQGVFYANSKDNGNNFTSRIKLGKTARHPQICALRTGKLAIVWEDEKHPKMESKALASAPSHDHNNHKHNSTGTTISLQFLNDQDATKTLNISDADVNASKPVIFPLKNKVIVAWAQEDQNKSGVYYKIVDLKKAKIE